ncbi:C2H2 finger domain protein [Xylaria cubensis]|nr:C2H2 finger domain protein [Xylaria cubensis]
MEMPGSSICSNEMADERSASECSSDSEYVEDSDRVSQDGKAHDDNDDDYDDDDDEISEDDGDSKITTPSTVQIENVEREIQQVEATLYDGNLKPPEFYREGIKGLDPEIYKRKRYSQKTVGHINNAENAWRRFCDNVLQRKDWKERYLKVTIQTLHAFFDWYLNQTTGKGGRRKRRTQKKNSLVTFWCMFRLAFERQHSFKINQIVDCQQVSNVIAEMNIRHGLQHQTRENRSMTLQDLKDQIETTLRTTEKSFKLGELRILAVLFLLLLAPQGSRPASILKLKFGDIELFLVRDPTDPNGPPKLVIRLSMRYTKQYLGPKATKHFFIPEIIYDPSLFLSPHVFLLAILFKHQAFLSDGLNNNSHVLSQLKVFPESNELPLTLKPEVKDIYVFRKPVKRFLGYELSQDPLPYETMSQWVRRIGTLLGFENNTICYNLRYMAGNNMDRDVNVSASLRNLVLDHAPGSDTFQKHYLNRNVVADLWAIHRNEQPQHALLLQATSHGHSKEIRRPIDLTPAQRKAAVDDNPEYQRLTQKQKSLPLGAKYAAERKAIGLSRANLRTKLRNKAIERVRAEWRDVQSVDDIERQIQGVDFSTLPADHRSSRPMGVLHQSMVNAIIVPLEGDLEALAQRRTNAINALVAYCAVQEEPVSKLTESRRRSKSEGKGKGKDQNQDQSKSRTEELKRSVSAQGMGGGDKVRRCFICVAKALTLSPTEPQFNTLCNDFYGRRALGRHLAEVHMRSIGKNDQTECPLCKVTLQNKMHLQNHAEIVHGIKTEKRYIVN